MSITLGAILLFVIFILYELFVKGWLFKIILFFAGWFGLYVFLRLYVEGAAHTAITMGTTNPISFTWASVIPTIVCLLTLLCTKVSND